MDKGKVNKLNKAAIASVLAASGVLVAIPQPTSAYMFKDLNPNADYYKPILDLYNRGVVSGYEDGTFRPHNEITRGQAAKMLTLALGLSTKNQSDPKFKDVPRSNPYYSYIATLANAGIINGFSDRTFKPDEPITRGQMSKIITIGYKLGVSTKIKDHFIDVTSKTSNATYIQTLYDLGITKGKTANTFEPFSTVTRAQLATFIWRAERADKGNPTYIIGDIKGDLVHINGVQYTIQPALRSIFNESNAAILKGAEIDGTFNGKILSSITKLTINASGTSNRLLALDGGHTSFSGELVINSSYVRLKNWTLTGQVTIAETPRKSLAIYTERLKNLNIASISGFGFIDWDKPTDDDDDYLNPGEDETLKPGKDPSKPNKDYTARMAKVERYIDFENTYVSNLLVEQTGTFISSDTTLSRVTIARDVENVEIYADMTTLYLEGDRNLKIYGVHDIETVYKNNYKSTYFNTDSYIDFLYVDNSFGWLDIGEFVYIGKVIIPKDKTPNDIFDDYYNDNDNIGNIVDTDDKPVDRDPIENQETPDETRPVITGLKVIGEGTSATATFTSNEDGTYYYAVREASQRPPTIREILQENKEKRGTATAGKPVTFTINDLKENTEYVLYLVVVDNAENISDKMEAEFETTDGTPPRVMNLEAEALHGGQRVKIKFKPSEPGDYYYYIRPATTAPAPTTADIIASYTGKGYAASKDAVEEIITNLEPNKDYEIYVVMKDDSGIVSTDPAAKTVVTTSTLDTQHPFVVGSAPNRDKDLVRYGENQFYMYFSEKLDPKTANDVQNYDLSGTIIINTTGQKTIKPSAVKYEENGGKPRVLLTIPSGTGFVNGDTLKVNVLPGVKDLANLEFENVNTVPADTTPRNYATYTHTDGLHPELTNIKITKNPGGKTAEVEYTANKAGSIYYLIMPNTTDLTALGIDERDFYEEFGSKPTTKFDKSSGGKIYIGGTKDPVSTELGKQKFYLDLSTINPDSFITYDLYMILRDRSGNLSDISKQQLITDTKPPLVSNISVTPQEKDKTATLKFIPNEDGNVYYKAVEKYVLDPATNKLVLNPLVYNGVGELKPIEGTTDPSKTDAEREAAFKAIGGVMEQSMSANVENIFDIKDLTPHKEYVLVMGVKDRYGNFTVKSQNTGKDPSDLNQPDGPTMMQEFYSDGTKPKIDPVIRKISEAEFATINKPVNSNEEGAFGSINYGEDQTFVVTFSESIDVPNSINPFFVIKDGNGSTIASTAYTYEFEALNDASKVNTINSPKNTWSERRMVIKFNSPMHATFSVVVDKDAVDSVQPTTISGGNNKFGENAIGLYKYQNSGVVFRAATLMGNSSIHENEYAYHSLQFAYEFAYPGDGLTYYYAVRNSATPGDLTPEEIIEAGSKANQIVDGTVTGIAPGIVVAGKGKPENETDSSFNPTLTTKSTNPDKVFFAGHRIYFATVDKYGNVSQGTLKGKPNQKYVEIQRYIPK